MKQELSRRERQIMDILYRLGRASAAEVEAAMDDAPSYSAVRAHLRVLEEKGHVRHEQEQLRYVYLPVINRAKARKSAVRHLVETFFGGSASEAMAALLDEKATRMTPEELDRLSEMIEEARKK
ncbi:MAG: BlaI/MecI/CopY family transcriptional regulator [Bryobacter sp.]|jgi:predicted transcriptional regulator|nr:BlaI/MecI/CopY family transcriptional regulator [Bryobacter sp. CoA8 C33]